jgi:hypothetical protein
MNKYCHNSPVRTESFLRSPKRMATLTFRIPARLIRRAALVNDNGSWRVAGCSSYFF